MKTKSLLAILAAVELLAGIGLLLSPSLGVTLLLGMTMPTGAAFVVARVAGLALVAIGLTCWLENMNPRAGSLSGLLVGLLFYNTAVPLLLILSVVENDKSGIALWPTVALHWAFSVWIVACLYAGRTKRPRQA